MLTFIRALIKRTLKTLVRFTPGHQIRVRMLRWCGYSIGEQVVIGEDLIIGENYNSFYPKLFIGDRVAIAPRVSLITASGPSYSQLKQIYKGFSGKIIIEDDAWIGTGAIIMPDVTVGQGAIVGAGAVVTKDIPPFTVVVGIPARPVKRILLETREVKAITDAGSYDLDNEGN